MLNHIVYIKARLEMIMFRGGRKIKVIIHCLQRFGKWKKVKESETGIGRPLRLYLSYGLMVAAEPVCGTLLCFSCLYLIMERNADNKYGKKIDLI